MARSAPGRSARCWPRSTISPRRRPRDRPRGPGPRLLRPGPGGAGSAASSRSSARWRSGSTGCACCTCTRRDLDDALIEAICATGVPYFDLSLQHVAAPLVRRMRRWGDGDRFLARIDGHPRRRPRGRLPIPSSSATRARPRATTTSCSSSSGGPTRLGRFFAFSSEDGTHAADLTATSRPSSWPSAWRVARAPGRHHRGPARRHVGTVVEVLVDAPGVARSHREAPEIDGIVFVPTTSPSARSSTASITGAAGPDLEAVPVTVGAGPA